MRVLPIDEVVPSLNLNAAANTAAPLLHPLSAHTVEYHRIAELFHNAASKVETNNCLVLTSIQKIVDPCTTNMYWPVCTEPPDNNEVDGKEQGQAQSQNDEDTYTYWHSCNPDSWFACSLCQSTLLQEDYPREVSLCTGVYTKELEHDEATHAALKEANRTGVPQRNVRTLLCCATIQHNNENEQVGCNNNENEENNETHTGHKQQALNAETASCGTHGSDSSSAQPTTEANFPPAGDFGCDTSTDEEDKQLNPIVDLDPHNTSQVEIEGWGAAVLVQAQATHVVSFNVEVPPPCPTWGVKCYGYMCIVLLLVFGLIGFFTLVLPATLAESRDRKLYNKLGMCQLTSCSCGHGKQNDTCYNDGFVLDDSEIDNHLKDGIQVKTPNNACAKELKFLCWYSPTSHDTDWKVFKKQPNVARVFFGNLGWLTLAIGV
eukprot:TRINITY_DN65621_c9_g2_i3.p1 TRINITY_DN65621_c9_g2~~TRINITY_DN65621_c9_g2_i3.p1  ORF type:complete len:433 (-),score=40.80 TRINITY_DN65621_c9_g2_i3:197-1495(-)